MKNLIGRWFIILFIACFSESSYAQSNVWICGKLLTDQEEGNTYLCNDMFLFYPITTIAQTTVDKSGNFYFKFTITKPQVIKLFSTPFYITPGDSIFVNVTGNRFMPEKFEFRGRNANNYIYAMKHNSLRRSFYLKQYAYNFKNGLENYFDLVNVNKKILLNNLNDFLSGNLLTDNFKEYALRQIDYEFYEQLLFPFTDKNYPLEQIPISYLSIIEQIKLNDNSLVDKREYAFSALNLIKFKKLKYNGNELQLILNNSMGLTNDFLLTCYADKLISSYNSKDSLATKELFKIIDKGIVNPEFRSYYEPFKDQLNKYLTPFPREVMHTAIIDSLGDTLTFYDLLTKYKNKIIVLDFWASWCGSCIKEMSGVNKLQNNFSNAEVEFIFMALDKTETAWRSGLAKTKIPGNHYWIKDNFNSALIKYLIINAIPRYVIINKTGKLEKINAYSPMPGEYGLEFQISKLLKH
jgi:thiol-disulfide isomerase/thioredoxin